MIFSQICESMESGFEFRDAMIFGKAKPKTINKVSADALTPVSGPRDDLVTL
jgi:hypothetical protein